MSHKSEKIIKVAALTVSFLSVTAQVVLFNYDSTYGRKYREITVKVDSLQTGNLILSQKIASYSAMATIAQKAEILGLKPVSEVVSLARPEPVADIGKTL